MNIFRGFTSSSKKPEAEESKATESVCTKSSEKPPKDPHWRLILRHPDGRDVRLEWRSGEVESAKAMLGERVERANGLDTEASNESLPASLEDSSSGEPGEHSGDTEGRACELDWQARSASIVSFLEGANLLKIERLDPAAKKLDESSLPIIGEMLQSLKVLRLSGEDVLTDGALLAIAQTGLQELDLSGQKLDQQRFEDLLFAKPTPDLSHLRLRRNLFRGFPASILEQLPALTELDLSANKIVEVPGSLLQLCPLLESLNLQNNRLTVPALNFRDCKLRALLLGLNALEYVPNLAALTSLSSISIFSLHVQSRAPRRDPSLIFEALPVHAELLQRSAQNLKLFPYTKRAETELKLALRPLLRSSSSSCHELLASLLAGLAEDSEYRNLLADDTAAKLLLSMCQVAEPVCWDACVAVSRLLSPPVGVWVVTEESLMLARQATDILIHALKHSHSVPHRLYLLQALRSMASSSSVMSVSMLHKVMAGAIVVLQDAHATRHIQYYVLKLLGELASVDSNRRQMLQHGQVLAAVRALAQTDADEHGGDGSDDDEFPDPRSPQFGVVPSHDDVQAMSPGARDSPSAGVVKPAQMRREDSERMSPGPMQGPRSAWQRREENAALDSATPAMLVYAARKVMAVMGDNGALRASMNLASEGRRGVRVLSVDGGGVKGIASIRMLAALEARCGRPLHSLFDLICGTSAGGIVACAMGNRMSMAECERVYRVVSRKAFSVMKVKEGAEEDELANSSWWSRFVAGSSTMRRVLLSGAKYDAAPMLQAMEENFWWFCKEPMIEHSVDARHCKVAVVSTCCSQRPISPFVFRSYQLPPGTRLLFDGACRHPWLDALRATSAAPYFFEEFACGGERFQDGAIACNNPAVVALHEAQSLWPGRNIDVLVSVGTGKAPSSRRPAKASNSGWGLMETFGSFLVESATSSDRVEEALEVLSSMVPNTSFFRLQVTDEACDVEIDDLSPEANTGLCAAAEKFVQENAALLSDCSEVLLRGAGDQASHSSRGDTTGREEAGGDDVSSRVTTASRWEMKRGMGVALTGLVIESRLGEEEDGAEAFGSAGRVASLLETVGVRSSLHSFRVGAGSSERRLDRHTLCELLRGSSAGLVYVACETLRSGGDLVLDWSWEAMEVSAGDAAELLLRSASHCEVGGLHALTAQMKTDAGQYTQSQEGENASDDAADADAEQEGGPESKAAETEAMDGKEGGDDETAERFEGVEAAKESSDANATEERQDDDDDDEKRQGETLRSQEDVIPESETTECDIHQTESARRKDDGELEDQGESDGGKNEQATHSVSAADVDPQDRNTECAKEGGKEGSETETGASHVKEETHVGGLGDEALDAQGAGVHAEAAAGVEGGATSVAHGEGDVVDPDATDTTSVMDDNNDDDDDRGQTHSTVAAGGEDQAASEQGGCSGDGALSEEAEAMLSALRRCGVVDLSPLERWVFLGVDTALRLRFGRAKASQIVGWEALAGAGGGLRGKVVVLRHAVPVATAKLVVAGGADAVVMPAERAGEVPAAARRESLQEALALLAEGRSPAFAVAQANGTIRPPPLICVY